MHEKKRGRRARGIAWEFDKTNLWITGVMMPVHVITVPDVKLIVVSSELPPWKDVEGRWSINVAGSQAVAEIRQLQDMLGAAIAIDHRDGFNPQQFITVVVIRRTRRQVFHMLQREQIKGAQNVGGCWVASRAALQRQFCGPEAL